MILYFSQSAGLHFLAVVFVRSIYTFDAQRHHQNLKSQCLTLRSDFSDIIYSQHSEVQIENVK